MEWPDDAEDVLRGEQPGRPKPPEPERRWEKIAKALGWAIVGAVAVLGLQQQFREKEEKPSPPPRVVELKILESRRIGPSEELRVIWMPDEIKLMGYRCLLYTSATSASLSCPSNMDFAPEEGH